jgi:hypothetical protein
MSKLTDALRKRYASPEAALRALGLSPDLINPPRMAQDSLFACDEDLQAFKRYWGDYARNWKPSNVAATVAADERPSDYSTRWPAASRIKVI